VSREDRTLTFPVTAGRADHYAIDTMSQRGGIRTRTISLQSRDTTVVLLAGQGGENRTRATSSRKRCATNDTSP
jgi:hypothetical protein